MIDLATTHRQFLRPLEVAEVLGVCRRTVYNWVRDGKLPSIQPSRTIRIPVVAVRLLIVHQHDSVQQG